MNNKIYPEIIVCFVSHYELRYSWYTLPREVWSLHPWRLHKNLLDMVLGKWLQVTLSRGVGLASEGSFQPRPFSSSLIFEQQNLLLVQYWFPYFLRNLNLTAAFVKFIIMFQQQSNNFKHLIRAGTSIKGFHKGAFFILKKKNWR